MAVTALKKAPKEKPPDRTLELMDVIEVSRGYLADHPGDRSWAALLDACLGDGRCRVRRVTRGDNSCSLAWAYRVGHPQAPPRNVAWFREGPGGQALLYQQGWRGCDPPEAA